MKRSAISWSIKQVYTMINKTQVITFDNPVQRPAGQWKIEDKTLLFHSILTMFVPDIYVIKYQKTINEKEINHYDVIDGLQRLSIISDYKQDKFALTEMQEVTLDDGTTHNISGLLFSELPEEVQDAINSFMLNFRVIELEDGDDEETIISELFYRLNNGKSVSREHLALVAAKPEVQKYVQEVLSNNKLYITTAHFPDSSVKKSDRQSSVMQSLLLISGIEYKSFGNKDIENVFSKADISKEIFEQTTEAFNMIHEALPEYNKFVTKVALTSLVGFLKVVNFDDRAIEFIRYYSKASKKSDPYRKFTGAGGTKKAYVEGRINGLVELYNKYIESNE